MKTIYWTSTIVISAFLLLSAYSYIFSKSAIEGFRELGFPDFFRIQLVVLKIVAAVLLLIPFIPVPVKDWSYAGVALFLITALVAHLKHKDSIVFTILLIVLLGVVCVSNLYMHKLLK